LTCWECRTAFALPRISPAGIEIRCPQCGVVYQIERPRRGRGPLLIARQLDLWEWKEARRARA
jgi:hypothetical protein